MDLINKFLRKIGLFRHKTPYKNVRNTPLTRTYCNFKMYDKSGKRLAIFADKIKDDVVFTVYKCSKQDNFNKREIKDAYATKSTYYHPVVWSETIPFTRNAIDNVLSQKYYKSAGFLYTRTHLAFGKIEYDETGKPLFHKDGYPVLKDKIYKKIKKHDIIQ